MTRNLITRSGLLLLPLLLPLTPLRAEDPQIRDLLRDALYTEEVSRDPDKAGELYEKLLTIHEQQRPFAATALFRLAEVRRKQDRTEEAIQLYQRLIREFPAATAEVKLAAGNLSTLGAKVPAAGDAMSDEETIELRRLQSLATTGPDVLKDPGTLETAADKGWLKVTEFLLDSGNDPYASDALQRACGQGYLQICRTILEKQGLPPDTIADEALVEAVRGRRMEILKLFLTKKFDVNRPRALSASVAMPQADWNKEITELLVAHGADLNRMPSETSLPELATNPKSWKVFGTPLHDAIASQNFAAANFLLDKGCNPDLSTPDRGITPLHIAVSFSADGDAIVKRLLEKGADPNRLTAANEEAAFSPGTAPVWFRVSPMSLATTRGKPETLRLLLAAGGDPKQHDVLLSVLQSGDEKTLELLLDAGADPNLIVKGTETRGSGNNLLGSLVDFGYREPGKKERLFQILIDHGASPSPNWVANRFSGAPHDIKKLLNRRFLYAQWAKLPQVSGYYLGRERLVKMIEKTGDAPPENLAAIFTATIREFANPDYNETPPQAANIVRFKEDGSILEIPVDFTKDDPLPALQWGDVVEFMPHQGREIPQYEFAWSLRKHLSAQVTLEIAGEKKELTLLGKRLMFDPTSNQVPWASAGELIDLFWAGGVGGDRLTGMGAVIEVKRKDWPDLRLDFPSQEARRFVLRSGDHLSLSVPAKVEEVLAEWTKTGVTVVAPGLPYTRFFSGLVPEEGEDSSLSPLFPTLAQVIAQIYGGDSAISNNWTGSWRRGDPQLLGSLLPVFGRTNPSSRTEAWRAGMLPYPDFADIRILRKNADGNDAPLKVDWSKLIESAEEAPPEDIKKADLELLAGDVIELRIRANRPPGDWKGFSPKEEKFLAKALQGKIQVLDQAAVASLQQINYKAPEFIESPAGWLPVWPETGTASVTVGRVLDGNVSHNSLRLTRSDVTRRIVDPEDVFVRDGDTIRLGPYQQPRPPRQRMLPSAPQPQQPQQPGQPQPQPSQSQQR